MAGSHDVAVKWGEAVKALNAFNGEVFIQGSSVASYISRVVRNICKEIPSPLHEDLTHVKGRHRLAKEVAGRFDHAFYSRRCEEACIIGLHGLGGSGKTTMCKIMVNFYSKEYPGRCCHLEFPTDGTNMPQIVQGCKHALKQLSNLSDEHVLNRADNFDQVIQLMKQHLSQRDVFLTIDNVWESSLEAASRILGVGFSTNSKILLTSRSVQVLNDLLRGHNNACVHPLPALEHGEAFQIFKGAFGEGDINSLGSRDLVERIMERFLFGGNYHALALKALGGHVREGCTSGDSKKNEDFLARLLQQIRNEDLGSLENAIRLSYDILPEHRKHLFLDIAALTLMWDYAFYRAVTYARAHQWLSILYKDQFSETKILTLIHKLALDGLVQIETDGRGEDIIRVHDLVADLADREAAASSRFFITGRSNRPVEEIEWKKLERVILSPYAPKEFIEKLQRQECRKLQLLRAYRVDFLSGIDMHHMPSLCVLSIQFATLRRIQNWSSASSRLGIVLLSDIRGAAAPCDCIPGVQYLYNLSVRVLNLSFLIQLQVLDLKRCSDLERIQGLDSLKNLQRLSIEDCQSLEYLDGLSSLSRLQALRVESCDSLKRLPDLSGLACLEELVLVRVGNINMKWEEGFSPPALRIIQIRSCRALKRTPDFSRSTCLEAVELSGNDSLEEVQGVLSSALTDLAITGSWALKKVPADFGGCTRLHSLRLYGSPMEELEGLSSTIRVMVLFGCRALKRMPSGLTRLEMLELHVNDEMEVGCLSSSLMQVKITLCKAMKRLDLSGLTRLETLCLSENRLLEAVGCLSSTLKHIEIAYCGALRNLPDVSGLTRLESLHLQNNGSMEEVGGQHVGSTLLKDLTILQCTRMRSFPSLKACVNLREVTASPDALAFVASSSLPNLHTLKLEEGWEWMDGQDLIRERISHSVIIDLGCLSPLTSLKILKISRCIRLEEIANSGRLQGLERLNISGCGRLKKLDGFRDIQTYDGYLVLQRCPSREDIHWRLQIQASSRGLRG